MTNYGNRVSKNKLISYLSTFSVSGYALPGIILAVAFITFISWFSDLLSSIFGFNSFKNVFIGSNSSLVAPIKIEKDSIVGAGSVITKNVKKKSLAISRSPQIEVKDYKKRKKK